MNLYQSVLGVGRCVVLAALCVAGSSEAQRLDPHFGGDGRVSLGFTPVDGHETDHAVVACASGSRLLVSGLASGGWRVVTAALTENGGLDTQFSEDGKETFNPTRTPRVSDAPAVGACLADGSPVLAYSAVLTATESALVVIKLDPATGLPDPDFGNLGSVELDLASGDAQEFPRVLNVVNGELLLGGELLRADGQFGAVVRLDSAGNVLAQRVLDRPQESDWAPGSVTAVVPFDESWLLFGMSSTRNPDLRNAVFAALSSDFGTLSTPRVPDRIFESAGRGRLVAPGVMAVPAMRRWADGVLVPSLLVIRESGDLRTLEFRTPGPQPIAGQATSVSNWYESPEVIPLPDGRVALLGTLSSLQGGEGRGMFAAIAVLGETPDALHADLRFGDRGWWQVDAGATGCPRPDFALARTTLWSGRLTFAGRVLAQPCGASPGDDYWVARMQALPLFANGFE